MVLRLNEKIFFDIHPLIFPYLDISLSNIYFLNWSSLSYSTLVSLLIFYPPNLTNLG